MANKTAVKGTKKGASLDKKVAPAVKNLRGGGPLGPSGKVRYRAVVSCKLKGYRLTPRSPFFAAARRRRPRQ